MISELRGKVLDCVKDALVVEVGGVGLEVRVTPGLASSSARGEEVHVYTRLVVREDAWSLYGFRTREERACFDLLSSVRGVGPKVTMSALSCFRPEEFYRAVLAKNDEALLQVPGIGRKTAGRITLELRDKIGLGVKPEPPKDAPLRDVEEEALQGLLALGYGWQEAKRALEAAGEGDGAADLETLLREALRRLAGIS